MCATINYYSRTQNIRRQPEGKTDDSAKKAAAKQKYSKTLKIQLTILFERTVQSNSAHPLPIPMNDQWLAVFSEQQTGARAVMKVLRGFIRGDPRSCF